MLDVIELFGERTTRDELGLGGVRDAFADLLFPGTSTIQTRARYFLFTPWVYLALEARRTPSAQAAVRGRKLETELMRALEESDDLLGLIGRLAKENIRRLPSNVYWQGLGAWGIRSFPGSQDEYHRSLDLFYLRRKARRSSRHEFEGEAADEPDLHNWHTGLPPAPKGFPQGVSFTLLSVEAAYLCERVLTHCPHSLLAHLLRERVPVDGLDFAWQLADLPDALADVVRHGRNFSEVLHGAQVLYNLMLAEQKGLPGLADEYRELFAQWSTLIEQRRAALGAWNRQAFWRTVYCGNPRISSRARGFVDRWADLVLGTPDAAGLAGSAAARQLLSHRELQLKGGLARLRGGRPLETWNGASGIDQLDLRWGAARRITADILAGLETDEDA